MGGRHQRHDLATTVQSFREFLRIPLVRLGQRGDLDPQLIGRYLELLRASDALQREIRPDRSDRMLAGILL